MCLPNSKALSDESCAPYLGGSLLSDLGWGWGQDYVLTLRGWCLRVITHKGNLRHHTAGSRQCETCEEC